MNIHPLIVHFPIAFLFIYSLMEICRFAKINRSPHWFHVKAFIVVIGAISAFITLDTGETAAHLLRKPELRYLIGAHANWASIATTIFCIIGIIYLAALFRKMGLYEKIAEKFPNNKNILLLNSWKRKVAVICEKIIDSGLIIIPAILGFIAIAITGALGGAIVYGPNIDPFVSFVIKILGL